MDQTLHGITPDSLSNGSNLYYFSVYCSAHQQRAHPRREERVRVSLAGVLSGAATFQSSVHAGGSHAQTHGREATQVHCESIMRLFNPFLTFLFFCRITCSQSQLLNMRMLPLFKFVERVEEKQLAVIRCNFSIQKKKKNP